MAETIITKRTSQSKYQQTDKGKATEKRYEQSEKGKSRRKKATRRYKKTKKGKLAEKRYRQSEKSKQNQKRYYVNHPEKVKALHAVNNAIRDGKMIRPDTFKCSCGKQAKHYHHPSYAPEHRLCVIPLCVKCHKFIHC